MKTKIEKRLLGHTRITFIIDCDDAAMYLDTEVKIEDEFICFIAGDTIDEFYEQIKSLVDKYRI